MGKTPETTIATLDLGETCQLTLTNKHLRGRVTRFVEVGQGPTGRPIKKLQKDTLDVLLSGVAGYSLDFLNMKVWRIFMMIVGILVTISGIWGGCALQDVDFLEGVSTVFFIVAALGFVLALLSLKFPRNRWAFQINVMGGKNEIPVAVGQTTLVRDFITKLQNAKIAYEEETA